MDFTINGQYSKRSFLQFLKRNFKELFIYRYALKNFVNSNLQNRYRRSTLGFLWSLLNPLFSLIILSVVFSLVYQVPIQDFGLYVFSGLIPWQMLSTSVLSGCNALVSAEAFLKKVYVPKAIFPLMITTTEVINFFFSLISLFILAIILGVRVGWVILMLPFAIFLIFLFASGIVLSVSVFTVYFRDLSHITQVVTTGAFYVTPIIYKLDLIPQQYHFYLKLNPFFYFINLFHRILYDSIFPTWEEWGISLGLAVASFLFGAYLLYKKETDIIYRL